MFALIVRFDCRDETAARRFDELTDDGRPRPGFHARKDPLLAGTRVEFLEPGAAKTR